MVESKAWNRNAVDKSTWLEPSEESYYLANKWKNAGDGAEQDVYVIGEEEPLQTYTGIVVGVYHRYNDNEDKWIVASGKDRYTKHQILDLISFQEKYFDGVLVQ